MLVILELIGGNDGINTVVPFADEGYAKHRKALRLPREQLIRVGDEVGLHPALKPLARTWEDGKLAIIQGGRVRGGLVGTAPRLLDLEDGDLKWSLDFRRVSATVLEGWLGVSAEEALGGTFEPLPVFRS